MKKSVLGSFVLLLVTFQGQESFLPEPEKKGKKLFYPAPLLVRN